MKKFIPIFLIIIFLFSPMSSCKKENEKSLSDKYFIFVLNDLLVKINVETAVSTTICQDPLCDHSDLYKNKCPFYCLPGAYSVTESGNVIYFLHETSEKDENYNFYSQVKKYNLLTGELKICYTTKDTLTSNIAYKEDYYFTEICYEKDENNEIKTYTSFYKITAEDETIKLNNDKIEGNYFIEKIENDRIFYFQTDNPTKSYNATLDLKDNRVTEQSNNKKTRKFKFEKDPQTKYAIIKSADDSIITDKAYLSLEIGDYVYYTKFNSEKELIIEDTVLNRKYYKVIESKLYRAKYDGSENIELCDFGDHLDPFYLNNYNYKSTVDNYCLIRFNKYCKDSDGQVYIEYEYAVLNIITGEYKMVT